MFFRSFSWVSLGRPTWAWTDQIYHCGTLQQPSQLPKYLPTHYWVHRGTFASNCLHQRSLPHQEAFDSAWTHHLWRCSGATGDRTITTLFELYPGRHQRWPRDDFSVYEHHVLAWTSAAARPSILLLSFRLRQVWQGIACTTRLFLRHPSTEHLVSLSLGCAHLADERATQKTSLSTSWRCWKGLRYFLDGPPLPSE